MTILITRPSPYGNQLVNQLNSVGKTAWHLPLITFSSNNTLATPLKKQLTKLSDNDLIFIMSQTAINYTHTWLVKSNITWPKKILYYAIGKATALHAYKFIKTNSITYPKTYENSEELLKLPELNNTTIKGKRALILCGQGGRKILINTLQQRGMQVAQCESYSRTPIFYDGEKQTQRMITQGINIILITSKDILQHLYNLIPNHYKTIWLMKCKLVVISKRIAIHANKLGWRNIIITNTTNNNHLIEILLKI